MNIRYAHSPLARAFAGVALAASIVAGASPASAVSCTFAFPTIQKRCSQGTSFAETTHFIGQTGAGQKYSLFVDMLGGTIGAVAYGIDSNGLALSKCATTAADDDPRAGKQRAVSCSKLYDTTGTAKSSFFYDYPLNMRSTFLLVI